MKKKLWVTYAWTDNVDGDVDYVMAELERTDQIEVHFDKRRIVAGQRLWEQISTEITNPAKCDAWAFVVTPDSLASAACLEELAYALDRALASRGQFPMIPLVHKMSPSQLPPVLRVRLAILLRDAQWVDDVVAATKGLPSGYNLGTTDKWKVRLFPGTEKGTFVLEVHPRVGSYAPTMAAIPREERSRVRGFFVRPSGDPSGVAIKTGEVFVDSAEQGMWAFACNETIDHNHSLYILLSQLPSRLHVGKDPGPLSPVDLDRVRNRVW